MRAFLHKFVNGAQSQRFWFMRVIVDVNITTHMNISTYFEITHGT